MADYRVLLVDDEEEFVASMAKKLEARGVTVEFTTDPKQSLQMMKDKPFDVVVLDRRMPEISGEDLFYTMHDRWPQAQIIMLTGYGSVRQAFDFAKQGIFCYLGKPCTAEKLHEAIEDAIKNRK